MSADRVLKPIVDRNGVRTSRWTSPDGPAPSTRSVSTAPPAPAAESAEHDHAYGVLIGASGVRGGADLDLRDPLLVRAVAETLVAERLYDPSTEYTRAAQVRGTEAVLREYATIEESEGGDPSRTAPYSLAAHLAESGYAIVDRPRAVADLLDGAEGSWSEYVYDSADRVTTGAAVLGGAGELLALAVEHEGDLAYAVAPERFSDAVLAVPLGRESAVEVMTDEVSDLRDSRPRRTDDAPSEEVVEALLDALAVDPEVLAVRSRRSGDSTEALVAAVTDALDRYPRDPAGAPAAEVVERALAVLPRPARAVVVDAPFGTAPVRAYALANLTPDPSIAARELRDAVVELVRRPAREG